MTSRCLSKRIGLVIGKLGYGGAETQLIQLGIGLTKRGHEVSVLCYDGNSTRDVELDSTGVKIVVGNGGTRREKLNCFREWQRSFRPQVVHACMKRASIVAVLGRRRGGKFPVIASDFSTATFNRRSPALWAALVVFKWANGVVTETRMNEKSLQLLAPWLRRKTAIVRNGLNTDLFSPPLNLPEKEPFRFAVVGSVYRVKNPVAVVQATSLLSEAVDFDFAVDWYGRKGLSGDGHPSDEFLESQALIKKLGIEDRFRFHGETSPILPAYQRSHALLHASLQEGFPNAVAEGMACGLPVVLSGVSDLPLVVQTATNGFVFDEKDPQSIADAMRKLLELDAGTREHMGYRSRQLAIDWFGMDRFIEEHEELYSRLLSEYQ